MNQKTRAYAEATVRAFEGKRQFSMAFDASVIATEDTLTTLMYDHEGDTCAWMLPQVFFPLVMSPHVPTSSRGGRSPTTWFLRVGVVRFPATRSRHHSIGWRRASNAATPNQRLAYPRARLIIKLFSFHPRG